MHFPFHFDTAIPGFFFIFLLIRGIFWIGILAVAVYLIKRLTENNSSTDLSFHSEEDVISETPLEIAKKRYARGEISKEEFKEIKKELNKDL